MMRLILSLFAGVVFGLALGFYVGWVQAPVEFVDSPLSSLDRDHADEGVQKYGLAQYLVGLVRFSGADEASDKGGRPGGNGAKEHGGHENPLVGQADGGQGCSTQVAD